MKTYNCLFLSSVLLSLSLVGMAQVNSGLPPLKVYSPLEYGAHRQNWEMVQGTNGILYFANGKGLLSFNGVSWELTMIPNRGHVRSLDIDNHGTVYVGANNDFGQLAIDEKGQRIFQSYLPLIDTADHHFGRVRKTISTPEGVFFQAYHRIFQRKDSAIKTWRFSTTCYRAFWVKNRLYVVNFEQGLLQLTNGEFLPAKKGDFFINTRIGFMLPFGENILIGTRNRGLFLYTDKEITPFTTEVDQVLTSSGVYKGDISANNKIILNTSADGVYILDQNGSLEGIIDQQNGLTSNDVLSFYEDHQQSIWVNTQEGINRIDLNAPYTVYDERLGLKGTIQNMMFFDNKLYAASSEGLIVINAQQEGHVAFEKIIGIDSYCWDVESWGDQLLVGTTYGAFMVKDRTAFPLMDKTNFVPRIVKTTFHDNGLLIVLDDGFSYRHWDGSKWDEMGKVVGLSGAVRDLVEIDQGIFWLKTRSNGVYKIQLDVKSQQLDFTTPSIEHFYTGKGVPQGENNLFKIKEQVFLRSEEDSLYRYDAPQNRFFPITSLGNLFNLPEGKVLPKTSEENGEIWLDYFKGREKSLVRASKRLDGSYRLEFFPFSNKMQQFRDPYGNEIFLASQNQVWFSSMLGILQVDLNRLNNPQGKVPIILTEVRTNERTVFNLGMNAQNNQFNFEQNDLEFQFAAPHFQSAENIRYAYYLEGYDTHWSNWSKETRKGYTNLSEGDYIFQVKAKDDFDKESEIISYAFSVSPPWYRSGLALFFYCLFGALAIWSIVFLRSRSLRREQFRLEKIVAERTDEIKKQAEEIEELYEVKNRFLANISHEFRTPLTLILGPTKQLLSNSKDNTEKQQLGWIYKNSQKLLKLINQLLDLSKIDAEKLVLESSQLDLVRFCSYIHSAFNSLAKQKNIQFDYKSTEKELFVYFDPEKLEQVLNNLLSNAFKFTNEGLISIHLQVLETTARIIVKDSGGGIHPQQLPYIFERFYQADQDEQVALQGTGIGLALCKELVALHHGTINVESTPGKGTTFTIDLPLGRSHLKEEEIVLTTDYVLKEDIPVIEVPSVPIEGSDSKEKPLLLIVDDSKDMLDYIQLQLMPDFRFLKAYNGLEGLEIAQKELPDLIISDVMMPEMSGFEMSTQLKQDIKTDHIPIILLTARTGSEYKLKGLQTHADEYIQKPFNNKELALRVQNLIENRKRLRKRFAEKIVFQASEIAETPQEAQFLQQLKDSIEKHIDDPQFDVNSLCQLMGMSKSQLNRKMKAVLNKSPNQFIRSYRLEKARQLIQNGHQTLSEIAYDVGFSSPAYFSKCFHDEFGYPPSALVNKT